MLNYLKSLALEYFQTPKPQIKKSNLCTITFLLYMLLLLPSFLFSSHSSPLSLFTLSLEAVPLTFAVLNLPDVSEFCQRFRSAIVPLYILQEGTPEHTK